MLTLDVASLTKRYGGFLALDDVTFTVHPGRVTALLGPNGAGKSTTLRILLGLARPTGGTATVGGRAYAAIPDPARVVGAALDTTGAHPGLTARQHLRTVCAAAGLPATRVDELLATVGLAEAAERRTGTFSLGMVQRLKLATALVGDPAVLVLDEPANGLDPAGIAWLRQLLRWLGDSGRTVLVSSHVLTEVQLLADDVVILDRGRLVLASPLEALRDTMGAAVRVGARDTAALRAAVAARGGTVAADPDGAAHAAGTTLLVRGLGAEDVGRAALEAGIVLHELTTVHSDLETVFLELTARAGGAGGRP